MAESDALWMTAVIFLPTAFALGLVFFPRRAAEAMRWWSLFGTALTLGASLCMFINFYKYTIEAHGVLTNADSRVKAGLLWRAEQADKAALAGNPADANDWIARYPWIERFHIDAAGLPVVLCPNGELLRNPTEAELARCLGLVSSVDAARVYDVVVAGAGPAGLSAAVYAASDGLSVLVLDRHAFGGQAGASSRIENFIGFPAGLSGAELATRSVLQLLKFGARMVAPVAFRTAFAIAA